MGNPKGKPISSVGTARSGRRTLLSKQTGDDLRNVPGKSLIPAAKPQPEKKNPATLCMYVLDTNVLMHDPLCVFRFQEHHVFIPSQVVDELDNNKKGHDEKNKNSRESSRTIETITSEGIANILDGIPLLDLSGKIATGCLFLQTESVPAEEIATKPDDKILAVVAHLTNKYKDRYKIVLVSKDTNMRIKARARGLEVQDYRNDIAVEDTDMLYQGTRVLPNDFWDTQPKSPQVIKDGRNIFYEVSGSFAQTLHFNEFVCSDSGVKFDARVVKKEGRIVTLGTTIDYTHEKKCCMGYNSSQP